MGEESLEVVNEGTEQLARDLQGGDQDSGEVAGSHKIEVGLLCDGDDVG